KTDAVAARVDFEAALRLNPRSLPALQNLLHVQADRLKEPEKALATANRAAELYPEFGPVRAARAVVLARLGRRAAAHREAEKARLLSDGPTVTYQLACVYALTSTTSPADREKAFALLRQAFRDGFRDLAMFEADPDLTPVRGSAEFADIVRAVKELSK